MVIIHIANIDPDVIGGVCIAVPKMVRAQSKYADIGLINTSGKAVDGVRELHFGEKPDIAALPEPFNKPDIIIFHVLIVLGDFYSPQGNFLFLLLRYIHRTYQFIDNPYVLYPLTVYSFRLADVYLIYKTVQKFRR